MTSDGVADLIDALIRPRLPAASPLVVGICGSQGSGKTTVALELERRLTASGCRAGVVSIDDFYLSLERREELALAVHPLLKTRGVPGTHDLSAGFRLMDSLSDETIMLPRFDKAAERRSGDVEVAGPLDVLIFEGWCVGARPQGGDELSQPINALEKKCDPDGRWRSFVDRALAGDYQKLFARIDLLVLLAAPSFEIVAEWRIEQELALRAKGGRGVMSDDEIRWFVQHYERLTRHILAEMPGRADLVIALDEKRGIVVDRR